MLLEGDQGTAPLTSLGLAANGLGEDERGFYWRGIAYIFEPNTDPCGVEKNGPGV